MNQENAMPTANEKRLGVLVYVFALLPIFPRVRSICMIGIA